ncbi:MAG TPA: hypothetical protein VJ961_05480 [Mariprofundaceae bacterium]|nr:hypothetical protein [Mariprofundaceae bacterium]
MLSSGYFRYRWSFYRPILERGENPADLCRIDASELPLHMVGEDAREYIPYAVHPELSKSLSASIRRLHDYMERYVIRGEKVSAHQLPVPDATSRGMMQHLRAIYPHLSSHLLRHWCADPYGGIALHRTLQALWKQAWRQERQERAPWAVAVNILLLRLLRTTISQLPEASAGQANHVVMSVIGGAYLWSMQRFLETNAEHAVEVERIPRHEVLIIPATPIAFFPKTEDGLFSDAPHLLLSYGLEPDLAPRMRSVMREASGLTGKEILARLARDRMGDHLLKRSWARLCLWDLAASSGQGAWMTWALDSKRLDQLLTRTKELAGVLEDSLEPMRGHLFADWLLAQMQADRKADQLTPWRQDLRTLMAFRVFDADVHVETARRRSERAWYDRYADIVGKGRGDEASRALESAFHAGKVVLLQPDFSRPLHVGKGFSGQQAALRVDWTDYLHGMHNLYEGNMQRFLEQVFMPGVLQLLECREGVFLDEFGGSGCSLRGEPLILLQTGMSLCRQLHLWYSEMQKSDAEEDGWPAPSTCLALSGNWTVATHTHPRFGQFRMAYAPALREAVVGVAHRDGPDWPGERGRRPLGRVHLIESGVDNHGFVVTGDALQAAMSATGGSAEVLETTLKRGEAESLLPGFLLPDGDFRAVLIREGDSRDDLTVLAVHAGQARLAGRVTALFELLDVDSAVARLILTKVLSKRTVPSGR